MIPSVITIGKNALAKDKGNFLFNLKGNCDGSKVVREKKQREEPFSVVLSNVLINPFSRKLAYPLIK